jgi:hypothetical protein
MQNSCNCSSCPHQCNNADDENESMDDLAKLKAQKLIDSLKNDIQALGFKTEETEDGIKVSN